MAANPPTKQCPYCAETILAEAIKCRYCGSDLTVARPQTAPVVQPPQPTPKKRGGFRFLIYAIIGGVICAICSMAMAIGAAGNTPRSTRTPRPERTTNVTDNTSVPTLPPNPTAAPIGETSENPAPIGSPLVVDQVQVTVTSTQRGQPVTDMVVQGNMFNTTPEPDQEYLLVEISATCQNKEGCRISPTDFKVIGERGIFYDPEYFIAGVNGRLESTEFLQGANVAGKVFFLVGLDEHKLSMQMDRLCVFCDLSTGYFAVE